jgi:hypothetical protein
VEVDEYFSITKLRMKFQESGFSECNAFKNNAHFSTEDFISNFSDNRRHFRVADNNFEMYFVFTFRFDPFTEDLGLVLFDFIGRKETLIIFMTNTGEKNRGESLWVVVYFLGRDREVIRSQDS